MVFYSIGHGYKYAPKGDFMQFFWYLSLFILLPLASCKHGSHPLMEDRRPHPKEMQTRLEQLNLVDNLSEVRFAFRLNPGRRGLVKFCKPEETCQEIPIATSLNLTFTPNDTFSARVCSKTFCSEPWQLLLLRPLINFDETDMGKKPQKASSLVLSDEARGFAIGSFGNGEFLFSSYTNVKAQVEAHMRDNHPSLALTDALPLPADEQAITERKSQSGLVSERVASTRGLHNFKNTCYMNAGLQILHASSMRLQQIDELARRRQQAADPFIQSLNKIMMAMSAGLEVSVNELETLNAQYRKRYNSREITDSDWNAKHPIDEFIEPILAELNQGTSRTVNIITSADGTATFSADTTRYSRVEATSGENISFQDLIASQSLREVVNPVGGSERELLLVGKEKELEATTFFLNRYNSHFDQTTQKIVASKTATTINYFNEHNQIADIYVPFVREGSTEVYAQLMRIKGIVIYANGNHFKNYFREGDEWYVVNDKVGGKITITQDEVKRILEQESALIELENSGKTPSSLWAAENNLAARKFPAKKLPAAFLKDVASDPFARVATKSPIPPAEEGRAVATPVLEQKVATSTAVSEQKVVVSAHEPVAEPSVLVSAPKSSQEKYVSKQAKVRQHLATGLSPVSAFIITTLSLGVVATAVSVPILVH